ASRRRHTISKRDWSSDVCSSDLHSYIQEILAGTQDQINFGEYKNETQIADDLVKSWMGSPSHKAAILSDDSDVKWVSVGISRKEIGRASCRERVYIVVEVVGGHR